MSKKSPEVEMWLGMIRRVTSSVPQNDDYNNVGNSESVLNQNGYLIVSVLGTRSHSPLLNLKSQKTLDLITYFVYQINDNEIRQISRSQTEKTQNQFCISKVSGVRNPHVVLPRRRREHEVLSDAPSEEDESDPGEDDKKSQFDCWSHSFGSDVLSKNENSTDCQKGHYGELSNPESVQDASEDLETIGFDSSIVGFFSL